MKLKNTITIIGIASMFIFSACGESYKDQDMSGKFNGQDWTIKAAKVTTNAIDSSVYVFEFYDAVMDDPCSTTNEGNMISTTCPKEVGEHEFGMLKLRLASFNTPDEALMATNGAIEILSIDIDKKEVKGRMIAKYDDNSMVNGNFTAVICEENGYEEILLDQMDNTLDTLMNEAPIEEDTLNINDTINQ